MLTNPDASVEQATDSRAPKYKPVFKRNLETPPWRYASVREWEERVASGRRRKLTDEIPKPRLWMMIYDRWDAASQQECLQRMLRQRDDIRFLVDTLTVVKAGGVRDNNGEPLSSATLRASQRAKLREALSAIRPLERRHERMINVARRLFRVRLLCTVPMLEAKIDDNVDVHRQICDIAFRALKGVDAQSLNFFDACFRPEKLKRHHVYRGKTRSRRPTSLSPTANVD